MRTHPFFGLIALIVGAAWPARLSAQPILYVDGTASGADDGSSWCDAFVHLQDALTQARHSGGTVTEIHVAQGVYLTDRGIGFTPGDRNASFELVADVALRGGYAGCGQPDPDARDFTAFESVLSGDLLGDDDGFDNNDENALHVVKCFLPSDAQSLVEGFTITGGNATGSSGGGVLVGNGLPIIEHCRIIRNSAGSGGGISLGTKYNRLTIRDSLVARNRADSSGGGIRTNVDSSFTIERTLIIGNTAPFGGGLYLHDPIPRIVQSAIVGNSATLQGGGIWWKDARNSSAPTIENCTIVGNSAAQGGGLYASNNSYMDDQRLTSSIAWYNSAAIAPQIGLFPAFVGPTDRLFIIHSDVEGGFEAIVQAPTYLAFWAADCIDDDPLFVDPTGPDEQFGTGDDDLRLCPNSPAIGMGATALYGVAECCADADCDDLDPCNGTETCESHECRTDFSADCNANLIEDSCDLASGASLDCNQNLRPDECDIALGHSIDCDADGIPDECEDPQTLCDDGVPCTVDSCDPETRTCLHVPDHDSCDDGVFCNGLETCDALLGCLPGTPVECDDGVDCTVDSCDEELRQCTNAPNDALCDDGEPCNGTETCQPVSGCSRSLAADCNANDIEDSCDISGGGSSDANANGIPDECETGACCRVEGACAVTFQQECADGRWNIGHPCDPSPCAFLAGVAGAGCRYLRITPNPTVLPTAQFALRVTRTDIPCPPRYVALDSGIGRLIDNPLILSGSQWGEVLVADSELLPDATYLVQLEDDLGLSSGHSATLPRWGDVVGATNELPPDGVVDFRDVSGVVDRFRDVLGAPPMERCDIQPAVPDQSIDFIDIAHVVDAFKGFPCPFASVACP